MKSARQFTRRNVTPAERFLPPFLSVHLRQYFETLPNWLFGARCTQYGSSATLAIRMAGVMQQIPNAHCVNP
jgi:hypothetical protein